MNINVKNAVNCHELRDDSDEDGLQVLPASCKEEDEGGGDKGTRTFRQQEAEVKRLTCRSSDRPFKRFNYKTLCHFNGSELTLRPH